MKDVFNWYVVAVAILCMIDACGCAVGHVNANGTMHGAAMLHSKLIWCPAPTAVEVCSVPINQPDPDLAEASFYIAHGCHVIEGGAPRNVWEMMSAAAVAVIGAVAAAL